jgi:hypothetical protein
MFRVGMLPADLRAALDSENVIDLAESLAVVRRFSGSVPGLSSSSSVSRTAGALALTSRRVVATLAVQSDPAALAVDCPWDSIDPAAMTIEFSADGLKLDVDVRRVDTRFHGHLSLHYKRAFPADVLAGLPRTSLRQGVSAEFVCRALGVRPPRPTD